MNDSKMKIEKLETAYMVEYEDAEYFRFGCNSWYETMGESLEPIYWRSNELEEEFQQQLSYTQTQSTLNKVFGNDSV